MSYPDNEALMVNTALQALRGLQKEVLPAFRAELEGKPEQDEAGKKRHFLSTLPARSRESEKKTADLMERHIEALCGYLEETPDNMRHDRAYYDRLKDSIWIVSGKKREPASGTVPNDYKATRVMDTIRSHCLVIEPALDALLAKIDWDSKEPERKMAARAKKIVKKVGTGALLVSSLIPRMNTPVFDISRSTSFDLSTEIATNRSWKEGDDVSTTLNAQQVNTLTELRLEIGDLMKVSEEEASRRDKERTFYNKLGAHLRALGDGYEPFQDHLSVDNNWLAKPVGRALFECLSQWDDRWPESGQQLVIKTFLDVLPFTRTMRFKIGGETDSRTLEELAREGWSGLVRPSQALPHTSDISPGKMREYGILAPNPELADRIADAIRKFDERDRARSVGRGR